MPFTLEAESSVFGHEGRRIRNSTFIVRILCFLAEQRHSLIYKFLILVAAKWKH